MSFQANAFEQFTRNSKVKTSKESMGNLKVDPSKRILIDIETSNSNKKQRIITGHPKNEKHKVNKNQKYIVKPHEHDILCGRGNFANYHNGNSHFRELVKSYKIDYVSCAKPQKKEFSQLIYNKIRNHDPPGRFLKYEPTLNIWTDIGEKRALEKIKQALREGAPDIMKVLSPERKAAELILDLKTLLETGSKNANRSIATLPSSPKSTASNFYSVREERLELYPDVYVDHTSTKSVPVTRICKANFCVSLREKKKGFKPEGIPGTLKSKTGHVSHLYTAFCTNCFAQAAIPGPKIIPTRYF